MSFKNTPTQKNTLGKAVDKNNGGIAIQVNKLSKCYQIYERPNDRLKQFILPPLRSFFRLPPKNYFTEIWAVRDVTFELRKGETLGIIGFNGAGKSTLLQMICNTLTPTSGSFSKSNRIAALLELGAGFNPEFTGRENVFMACTLSGMSRKEIKSLFDDIATFADIGDFIDQPVKFYSSGMFARLAFSAAVHIEPDLLIVDEALGVGDMAFQEKSFNRMKEIRSQGTTILLVTHSVSSVRNFCDKALWLDRGEVRAFGERLQICDAYEAEAENKIRTTKGITDNYSSAVRKPSNQKTLSITSVKCNKPSYNMGDDICIEICLNYHKTYNAHGIGVIIFDDKENIISVLNSFRDDFVVSEPKEKWKLTIRDHHLAPGEYSITVSIPDEIVMFSYDKWDHCVRFSVDIERNSKGLAKVEGIVRCEHFWG